MRRARVVLLVLTGLLALAPWVMPHGASAQDQDPLPVPLPLDPLAPVLAVIGPASSGVCGGFGVVGLLAPNALGPLAPSFLSAVGPVFTLCGAIPSVPAGDRYTCALDQQGLTLIGAVTGLAGVPPAFDIRPIGQVLETLGVVLDLVLPPPQVDALLDQPGVVLQCQHGTTDAAPPPVATTVAQPPVLGDGPVLPAPGLPAPIVLPSTPVGSPRSPVMARPAPAAVTAPLGRVPFSYAAVFALPFLALLAGAAIGRDLLAPLPLEPDDLTPGGPLGPRGSAT